jgi:hypothetical protein
VNESRSIILRNAQIKAVAVAAVGNLPIDEDHPYEVVIRPYKANRKLEQLGLYWIRLAEIEAQAFIDGRRFAADPVLHEFCKREFLPDVCTKGIEKWAVMPGGERILKMSTGYLNVREFADYLTQVEAWGASLGVMFSEARR